MIDIQNKRADSFFKEKSKIRKTVISTRDKQIVSFLKKKLKSDNVTISINKPIENYPRITIERIGFDENDHVKYIDLHDEKTGEAIFFMNGSRHSHGFMNGGKFKDVC